MIHISIKTVCDKWKHISLNFVSCDIIHLSITVYRNDYDINIATLCPSVKGKKVPEVTQEIQIISQDKRHEHHWNIKGC